MPADSGYGHFQGCGNLVAGRGPMGDQVANEAASRPVHQNVRHGDHNQVMRALDLL